MTSTITSKPGGRIECKQVDATSLTPFAEAGLGLRIEPGGAEPRGNGLDDRRVLLVPEPREHANAAGQTNVETQAEDSGMPL